LTIPSNTSQQTPPPDGQSVSDRIENPRRRRQVLLGLILSGIGMVLAVLWGAWAVLHNETGVLIVTSHPPGAEVILNQRPTDLITSAFLSDLPADSFLVSVRLDGHRPVPPTQGVRIAPNETTRVTFIMAPIERGDRRPLPVVSGRTQNWQWRSVRIKSEPDSAALVVDDKELGIRTPMTLLLGQGLHHLQARWPDGARDYKNVTIDPGQSPQQITMKPATYERYTKPRKGLLP
jgi:hypothetical protein